MSLSTAFIKPFLALSVQPNTFSLDARRVFVKADPALFAFDPTAVVLATVFPDELALSVTLILFKFTDILLAIRPDQVSMSVHFVLEPLSSVLFAVAPNVHTGTLNFVHLELSRVDRSIGKC